MAKSKNPRKTGWFGVSETLQKKVHRRLPSWQRLRRRCAIAQIARRWNAKKKVEENVETPQPEVNRVTSTYIYSEKFDSQRVGTVNASSTDIRFTDPVSAKPRKKTFLVCRWGAGNVVCYSLRHIVSQPGAIYPQKFPIAPNYYQELLGKKNTLFTIN